MLEIIDQGCVVTKVYICCLCDINKINLGVEEVYADVYFNLMTCDQN